MTTDKGLESKSESDRFTHALIMAVSMLFSNVRDVTLVYGKLSDQHPEAADISAQLKSIACSTYNVSRMAIDVMPKSIQEELDKLWSKFATEKAEALVKDNNDERSFY